MFDKNYKSNNIEHIITEGEMLFEDKYKKLGVKKLSK